MILSEGDSRVSSTSFLYAMPKIKMREPFRLFRRSFNASATALTTWYGIAVLTSPASSMKRAEKSYSRAFQDR